MGDQGGIKMELIERNLQKGAYRKIAFEISEPTEEYNFYNYYIYIVLDFIQDEEMADDLWLEPVDGTIIPERPRKMYPYLENPLLSSLDFHGGITFYSKYFDSQDRRQIKIGCDYNHLFDQDRYYNQSEVLEEVKNTIDDFLSQVNYELPDYLKS